MPLYEFKCKKCGEINEFLLNSGENEDALVCKTCNGTDLEKILSMTNVSKYLSPKNGQTCCGTGEGCGRFKRNYSREDCSGCAGQDYRRCP